MHDFVDCAISGGARLAASSPANERKTFSVTSFFDILFSSYTQIQFVQKFCFMHVENGWQRGKEIKKKKRKGLRYVHKVSKQKAPSSGSIYFDFKAQEREEVCFSPGKISTL